MKRILFVCKYNRFRSRVAEFLFKKYNKDKSIIVKSAGLIRGRYPLDKEQVSVSKKNGIIIDGKPQGLSSELLIWCDTIIIVANDVPSGIFNHKKYKKKLIVWKIKDSKTDSEKEIEGILEKIRLKVINLVRSLK